MSTVGFLPDKPSITFLIAFVRSLDASLNEIESLWGSQMLTPYRFTHMIAAFVYVGSGAGEDPQVSGGLNSPSSPSLPASLVKELPEVPTIQAAVLWEKRMYAVHNYVSSTRDAAEVETFENAEYLMYCVFGIFGAIAQKPKQDTLKEISFHDFRAFVLNITIGGKNGVDDNEVKPLTLTRSPACKALYRMNKLKLFEEQNIILACIHTFGDNGAQLRIMDASSLAVKESMSLHLGAGNITALESCYLTSENSYARMRLIFLCSGDGFCRVYDYNRLRVMKAEVDMGQPCPMMRYLPKRNIMVFGNTKGYLYVADLAGMERFVYTLEISRTFNYIKKLKLHDDSITSMEADHFCDTIFTCGLDRMIYQIQLKDFTIVRRMSGHQMGINDLTYNHHYNTLVSCGMDYALYVWTLEATNVEPNLMVDASNPYHHQVMQVETAENKPFVVSMDCKGLIKVWDVRTLRCICTVACEPDMVRAELENLTWHCFVLHKKSYDVISAANRKIYIFEYDVDDRGLGSYCAHEGSISGACYEPRTRTLISCAKTEVQVWNAASGESINRVREVTNNKITAVLLLEGLGTLALATDMGHVKFISTASFAVLAESIHGSGQAIRSMSPLPYKNGVVAVAVSGHTEIMQYNAKTGAVVGQILERKDVPIKANCASSLKSTQGRFVLVGEMSNVVSIWIDEESTAQRKKKTTAVEDPKVRRAAMWQTKKYVEIMKAVNYPTDLTVLAIAPIPRLSCFVSIDSRGWLNMWAVDQDTEQTWSLAKWVSRRPPELKHRPAVTKAVVCEELMLLYTGDDFGQICCYDISVALGNPEFAGGKNPEGEPLSFSEVPPISAPRNQLIPPFVVAWEAHPESAVTELFILKKPLCIVSGGDDCRLQAMSLGGTPISMFIMRKVGQITEEQHGIDYKGLDEGSGGKEGGGGDSESMIGTEANSTFTTPMNSRRSSLVLGQEDLLAAARTAAERYNDLPEPYGAGLSTAQSTLDDKADELLKQQAKERELLKEAELGQSNMDEVFDSSLMSGGLMSLMSKSTLRGTRAPPVPFWKVQVPKLGAAPKIKTVERAPTVVLPSKEIIYSVPQYIGLDKVSDPDRPTECHYAPAVNVDHAMYGPDSNFWHMNHEASKVAKAAMKDAQEQEHRLAQVVTRLSNMGEEDCKAGDAAGSTRPSAVMHGSPSRRTQLQGGGGSTPPPEERASSMDPPPDPAEAITTAQHASPHKEAFVDWQRRITSQNKLNSEQERRREMARQLAEMSSASNSAASPTTNATTGGGKAPPMLKPLAECPPSPQPQPNLSDVQSPLYSSNASSLLSSSLNQPRRKPVSNSQPLSSPNPKPVVAHPTASSEFRRSQSVSEGMFASGPSASSVHQQADPRLGGKASKTPPPIPTTTKSGGGGNSKKKTHGAKQRAIQRSVEQLKQNKMSRKGGNLEQGLPEGMMVPQVRSLAGNQTYVKSHSAKPF